MPWGRREALAALAVAAAATAGFLVLGASSSAWALAALPVAVLGAGLALFFRNPPREVPAGPGLLVSPADGTVRDVAEVDEPEYVGGACVRIGIFLSIFDVHLNRSPCAGVAERAVRRPGRHVDARRAEASDGNECVSIGILRLDSGGPQGIRILVRQISGAIARRVVCALEPPARVARGGLIGMIKYGSRTELYIPRSEDLRLEVGVGDRVVAGRTVVASWAARAGEASGHGIE
ncbi:MAG: phosphatidylserine decarboxylase [Planctomycetota bacterium]